MIYVTYVNCILISQSIGLWLVGHQAIPLTTTIDFIKCIHSTKSQIMCVFMA